MNINGANKMGKDRDVKIKRMKYKECPDLYCHLILREDDNGNIRTNITALSKQEAIDVMNGLKQILEDEE